MKLITTDGKECSNVGRIVRGERYEDIGELKFYDTEDEFMFTESFDNIVTVKKETDKNEECKRCYKDIPERLRKHFTIEHCPRCDEETYHSYLHYENGVCAECGLNPYSGFTGTMNDVKVFDRAITKEEWKEIEKEVFGEDDDREKKRGA